MLVADNIKRIRESLGMNQKELADASGITQATISRIESGQVKELKTCSMQRLAKALGVSMDYLAAGKELPTLADIKIVDSEGILLYLIYRSMSGMCKEQLMNFSLFMYFQDREMNPRPEDYLSTYLHLSTKDMTELRNDHMHQNKYIWQELINLIEQSLELP
ncbi:MAG: helix-turn-helix domain-containing protein [Armatimonadota bacterium]